MKIQAVKQCVVLLLFLHATRVFSQETPQLQDHFGYIAPLVRTENGGIVEMIAELMMAPGLAIGPTFIEFGYATEQTSAPKSTLYKFGSALIVGAAFASNPGTVVIRVNVAI